ncbi:MAG: hypothetical protein IJ403_09380 [Oscillospiraceae bacterium]|nr:hypothetical protein [Oscillospiraceae bacterium]
MNTIKLDKQDTNVKMIAHRGLSGLERENTCAAFVAAGNREVYWGIETDIHCTADGKFVIIHDDTTTRVSGVEMTVEETDFDTLRSLHLLDKEREGTRWDLVLPTLEEYISICKKYGKVAVLELKNPMPEEAVCEIIRAVEAMDYAEHMVVISFSFDNMVYLRKNFPKQKAQFLLSGWDDKWLPKLKEYDLGLDIRHTAITAELVEKIHSIGQEINCWTVDTLEDAARVIACGVDYITTNILE